MLELRLRSKVAEEELQQKVGNILEPSDINIMLTGPVRLLKPDGKPLLVYLPGAIDPELKEQAMPCLHKLKGSYTSNRGLASGSERVQGAGERSYARGVDSAIVGAFEASGPKQYCRLTAFARDEMDKWQEVFPLLHRLAELMREHVPERYAAQAKEAARTAPDWVIPGTPFTTVTVNNTYPTGVHTDKGDLDEGFSNVICFRSGEFKGGWLCFPEYRVGVDLQDRDLILFDAHEWHGNTQFDPKPLRKVHGQLDGDPGFERISIVSYFRTKMTQCGSGQDEAERARILHEQRMSALVGE